MKFALQITDREIFYYFQILARCAHVAYCDLPRREDRRWDSIKDNPARLEFVQHTLDSTLQFSPINC